MEVGGVTADILRAHGYAVIEAANGSEALRLAVEHQDKIHLLLTDVVMPEMGGRPLAEQLRAARPEIKVLFVSGYPDDAFLQLNKLGPNSAFLRKPYSAPALVLKVQELLAVGQKLTTK